MSKYNPNKLVLCADCSAPFVRTCNKSVRCKACQNERARVAGNASRLARYHAGLGRVRVSPREIVCRVCGAVEAWAPRKHCCRSCAVKAKAAADRRRREVDRDKARARTAKHYALHKGRIADRKRTRRQADPAFALNERLSNQVRRTLKGEKVGRRWEALLGYTTEAIKQHLERQFLPDMGWHNMDRWHIDHIVPLASFSFVTPSCTDFRAAWALANLRPLWATDNVRKQATRFHLI